GLVADLPARRCLLENPKGGAVLDAANRVRILELGEQLHAWDGELHMRRGSQHLAELFQARDETGCPPRRSPDCGSGCRSHLELASDAEADQEVGGSRRRRAHRAIDNRAELEMGTDVKVLRVDRQPRLGAYTIERPYADVGVGVVETRGRISGAERAPDLEGRCDAALGLDSGIDEVR